MGNGETPQSSGKKGDHLVGDYYVLFEKNYKAEIEELMKQGLSKEEAEKSPLMQEAREMLRRWEAGDPEVVALWEMMNQWVYEGFDETYKNWVSPSTKYIMNRKPTWLAKKWFWRE